MTDYTSEIDAWYQAIQYHGPPASELASFNAQLQQGIITTAQAVAQIEASTYTQNYVDPVIRRTSGRFRPRSGSARRRLLGRPGRDQPRQPRPAEHRFRQFGRVLHGLRGQRHDAGGFPRSSPRSTPTSSAARRTQRASPIGPIPASTPRSCCRPSRSRRNSSPTPPPTSSRSTTRKSPATRRPAARFITK